MRRKLGIFLRVVAGLTALVLLASRSSPGRVLGKDDHIHVITSTGQWYHDYVVRIAAAPNDKVPQKNVDSASVSVTRDVFDATRMGARVRVGHMALLPGVRWISDSASAVQTVVHFVHARIKHYYNPVSVSALSAQTSGLARVVAVHSIQRRKFFWQKSDVANTPRWIYLVEVEFWAQRVRTLVRTIDVIDAGSIAGLHPGDVVQMHYDQRDARVVRLDDGSRTFEQRH